MNKRILILGGACLTLALVILLGYRIFCGSKCASEASFSKAKGTAEEMAIWNRAQKNIQDGDLLKARAAYQTLIEKFPSSNMVMKSQEALDDVNVRILFSPIVTQDSFLYEVQKGDALAKLAKKFDTTIELISKANNLKDANIRVGKKIKITKAKFSIIVDKSQNILILKSDGNILKTYRVATGKNNSTPAGSFKITSKIIDPPWYPPTGGVVPSGDPKNVLGSRWLGISKQGYGIHGTTDPDSIGASVTEGCVRLKNPDVEELYAIVPEGTEVTIVD